MSLDHTLARAMQAAVDAIDVGIAEDAELTELYGPVQPPPWLFHNVWVRDEHGKRVPDMSAPLIRAKPGSDGSDGFAMFVGGVTYVMSGFDFRALAGYDFDDSAVRSRVVRQPVQPASVVVVKPEVDVESAVRADEPPPAAPVKPDQPYVRRRDMDDFNWQFMDRYGQWR
jgi:hypothetical protein